MRGGDKSIRDTLGFREPFHLGRIEDVALESNLEWLLSPCSSISRSLFIVKGTKDHVDRGMKCCYLASSSPESTWLTGFLVFSSSPFRSELIQLVAVTQKTAERSYRELIEQQIQTYQRRSGAILCSSLISVRV